MLAYLLISDPSIRHKKRKRETLGSISLVIIKKRTVVAVALIVVVIVVVVVVVVVL